MKSVMCTVVGWTLFSAMPSAQAAAPAGDPCALTPVLIEDFASDRVAAHAIGPARWTAHTPWNGDFGDARFADPGPGSPFTFGRDGLTIAASRDAEGRWTSGLIAAADASGAGEGTRYGYFEARMRLPPGPGTWPAFWLAAQRPVRQGADADKKGAIEIDVIEYYGKFDAGYHSVVHGWYADTARTWSNDHVTSVAPGSLTAGFHDFGVDVSPQGLQFVLDGAVVWRQPTPVELDGPLYPIVNLALGSGWPIVDTPNPSRLSVKYVHVYGRGPGPAGGCPVGGPGQPK